jgi:hypothetical protein
MAQMPLFHERLRFELIPFFMPFPVRVRLSLETVVAGATSSTEGKLKCDNLQSAYSAESFVDAGDAPCVIAKRDVKSRKNASASRQFEHVV